MAGGPPLGQQPPGGLSPGDQVLVFYDDPTEQQWHARLLLSCITGDEWIILTPDGDIYGEQISSGNPDFLAWRPMDPNNVIPVGINRAHCGSPKHAHGLDKTRPRRFSLYTSSLKICFCTRPEVISTTLDAHAKVTLGGKQGW